VVCNLRSSIKTENEKIFIPMITMPTDFAKMRKSITVHLLAAIHLLIYLGLLLLSCRFQYVLAAATSIASKQGEETLTYLNQGQSYGIKLKKVGELLGFKGKLLKVTTYFAIFT